MPVAFNAQASPRLFPSWLQQLSRNQILSCPSLRCCPQQEQEQQAAQQQVEKLQERLGQQQGHGPNAKSALLLPVTHCLPQSYQPCWYSLLSPSRESKILMFEGVDGFPLLHWPRCRLLKIALMNLAGGNAVDRIRAISQNKVQLRSRLSHLSSLTNHKYERQSLPFLCTFCLPLDHAKAEGGCKCGVIFD